MKLEIRTEELREFVGEIAAQVYSDLVEKSESIRDEFFTEREAAHLLRLNERQLANERRAGNIRACMVVGKRIRYLRSDLVKYLLSRPWTPETGKPSGWRGERTPDRMPVPRTSCLGGAKDGQHTMR